MKNRAILTSFMLPVLQSLYSQKNVKPSQVVSYNVENLASATFRGPGYSGGPSDLLSVQVDFSC